MRINKILFPFFLLLFLSLSACTAAKPSAVPTATVDTAHWTVYQDLNHHFTFVYPKGFDNRPLCALKVKQADPLSSSVSISMNNSDIKVMIDPLPIPQGTNPDADLQAVDDRVRADLAQLPQVSLEKPTQLTVAGLPALAQRYRTAYNKDGYLEYVFFIKNGMLYTLFLNTPASCDGYPDTPSGVEAFQRILESFTIQ